jgi:pimeloyl-[acyl-carrier protein] methyl ester esterase
MTEEKPFLLMISGWGYPPPIWDPLVHQAAPVCDLRVIDPLPLLNSSGDGLAANAVDQIFHHLPEDRACYAGGWSLGGMIAMQIARHLRPRSLGLLLISATDRFCSDETRRWGTPVVELRAMRRNMRRDPEQTLRDFLRQSAFPHERTEAPWVEVLVRDADRLDAGLRYLDVTDLRHQDCSLDQPVAFLHGRKDAVVPHTASRSMAARIMPSRLDMIEDVGHELPFQRGDAVLHAVRMLAGMSG